MKKKFSFENATPEEISEHYRNMQRKAMKHPNNAKGTAKSGYNNVELAKAAGIKGRQVRYAKPRDTEGNNGL